MVLAGDKRAVKWAIVVQHRQAAIVTDCRRAFSFRPGPLAWVLPEFVIVMIV